MDDDVKFALVGLFIGLVAGSFAGCKSGIAMERYDTAKFGGGRWIVINERTGETKFQYGPQHPISPTPP